jgi:diguanylate cyclase (GGDEF)-like protein
MGSTNGTFLGGERILRAELQSGDRFQVGPNVVLRFAMVDEAEEALARQLYESSTRDALTGAYNRKYFFERLHAEVAFALRHGTRLGVILFDLDHFKAVNDTHGHIAGDQLLRRVATRVMELIRTEDVLARYGGEEFVLLARGIERPGLVLFAERVRRAVEELQVPWEDVILRGTISVGLADVDECKPEGTRATDAGSEGTDVGPAEAMLVMADERLYRAKAAGRNRVCAEGSGTP